jgi:hypothetical protein
MTQATTEDEWSAHYSMLTNTERNDPLNEIILLTSNFDLMSAQSQFFLLYATAESDLIKRKDYDKHDKLYSMYKSIMKCWVIAADISTWVGNGKLSFLQKAYFSNADNLNHRGQPQHSLDRKSKDEDKPIEKLFTKCAEKSLFQVREDVWRGFADIMMSTYTDQDSTDTRRKWIVFFRQSIRLWELCYRLRELLTNQVMAYSYH